MYGLYLEHGIPDYVDHRSMKMRHPIDRDMMVKEITKGLNELYKKASISLVIKKHPRTDRSGLASIGLEESKLQRADGARESSFVIAH